MNFTPNYKEYTLKELYIAKNNISTELHPKKIEEIELAILNKENGIIEEESTDNMGVNGSMNQNSSNELFNMEDAGVSFMINKIGEDNFEIKIAVQYNFIISYQKTWHRFELSSEKLNYLIKCLTDGIKSKHGNTSIWQANQMFVKRRKVPVKYCEIRMYHRIFILGFRIVPSSISALIIEGLNRIEIYKSFNADT